MSLIRVNSEKRSMKYIFFNYYLIECQMTHNNKAFDKPIKLSSCRHILRETILGHDSRLIG